MIFKKNLFKKYNIDNDLMKRFTTGLEKILDDLFTASLAITSSEKKAYKLLTKCIESAVKFLPHLDNRIDVDGWLFRILINKISEMNLLNPGQADIEKTELNLTNFQKMFFAENDLERMLSTIEPGKIKSALLDLPVYLKISVLLKDILKKSYEEASDLIDIPVDVLALRLNSARKLIYVNLLEHSNNDNFQYGDPLDTETDILITKLADAELHEDKVKSGIIEKTETNRDLNKNYIIQKKIKEIIQKNKNSYSITIKARNRIKKLLT